MRRCFSGLTVESLGVIAGLIVFSMAIAVILGGCFRFRDMGGM